MTPPDPIGELLKRGKTIAVVGLSRNPLRPSHGVTAYMQSHGYRIIPVNPQIEECLAALDHCEFSAAELEEIDRHARDGALNIWSAADNP